MRRTAPNAEEYVDRSSMGLGCWVFALLPGVAGVALFAAGWPIARVPAFLLLCPTVFIIFWELYELVLLAVAAVRWRGSEVRALLVYSDSPKWQDYIEAHWLPRLGGKVVTLNWSQHKCWKKTLDVRLFRRFGGVQEFNPLVIVLNGLRAPEIFRFYQAFRDRKHGNTQLLELLEARMFEVFEGPESSR